VLFGGGGHGRSVADAAQRAGLIIGAVVDPQASWEGSARLLRSDGEGLAYVRGLDAVVLLGIGANGPRRSLAALLRIAGAELPPLLARTATISPDARLGPGTVVLEHAHVGPGARLGEACVVNTGAIVEHDCELGPGVHCAPGSVLTGAVRCGAEALVGAGAVALPGRSIGSRATVGAGAVVTRDVAATVTVRGVPATVVAP